MQQIIIKSKRDIALFLTIAMVLSAVSITLPALTANASSEDNLLKIQCAEGSTMINAAFGTIVNVPKGKYELSAYLKGVSGESHLMARYANTYSNTGTFSSNNGGSAIRAAFTPVRSDFFNTSGYPGTQTWAKDLDWDENYYRTSMTFDLTGLSGAMVSDNKVNLLIGCDFLGATEVYAYDFMLHALDADGKPTGSNLISNGDFQSGTNSWIFRDGPGANPSLRHSLVTAESLGHDNEPLNFFRNPNFTTANVERSGNNLIISNLDNDPAIAKIFHDTYNSSVGYDVSFVLDEKSSPDVNVLLGFSGINEITSEGVLVRLTPGAIQMSLLKSGKDAESIQPLEYRAPKAGDAVKIRVIGGNTVEIYINEVLQASYYLADHLKGDPIPDGAVAFYLNQLGETITIHDFNITAISTPHEGNFSLDGTIKFGHECYNVLGSHDLDEDGYLDLAVTSNGNIYSSNRADYNDKLYICYGRGDGTFEPPVSLAVGVIPYELAMDDLNNDGHTDIAVGNIGDITGNDATIYLNNGLRSYTKKTINVPKGAPLNGRYSSNAIGTIGTQGGILCPAIADFDNDGKKDLVLTGYDRSLLYVYKGDGTGDFTLLHQYQSIDYGYGLHTVKVADFDGDGNRDLVVTNQDTITSVEVFKGNGDCSFTLSKKYDFPNGSISYHVFIDDFNKDGKPDFITCQYGGGLELFINQGNLQFTREAYNSSAYQQLREVQVADLNGDEELDVVTVARSTNSFSILYGTGNYTSGNYFEKPVHYYVGQVPKAVSLNDFNQDGINDLALLRYSGKDMLLMSGYANDSAIPEITAPATATLLYGASFDPLAGVGATDSEGNDITSSIKASDTVNTSKAGAYTLTYSVTDSRGNTASAKRYVTVTEEIEKASGAAVTAPTLSGKTKNSLTINAVTILDTNPGNQTVEYAISTENTASPTDWQEGLTFSGLDEYTQYYLFARAKETVHYNAGTTTSVQFRTKDETAPTGTITVKTNSWTSFLNTSTFGLFFKNTMDVTISSADTTCATGNSGVAAVEYLLSVTELASSTNWSDQAWLTYTETIQVASNWKGAIYARITDNEGNATVINSHGIVVYTDAAGSATVSHTKFSGDETATFILNGNTIKEINDGTRELTLSTDYTVSGGTITLKSDYLDGLAVGNYTLTISYNPMGESYQNTTGNDMPGTTIIALTVNKANPSVTLTTNPANGAVYNDSTILTATVAKAENGAVPTGNVTFKLDGDTVTGSSNIALNDDGTATFALTGLTAGNHTLSVEYGGDGNYNETSATLTITVNRKTIAVPAARTGLTYNGAAQIGVSEGTGYIVSSNTATNAGSYTAIVTPDGNHQWDESTDATASRTVDFTIGKKPVTVIADNKSKYVGADDPTLTYTVSPTLVSGDTLNGSLKYTGTTVGIYDIIENRAFDNPNYAVTFVKGTMTILHTPATDEVVVKIDNLPNPVKTVVDADKVTEVTNAYNALSDTEKAQISQGDKDKLVVAQMAAGTVNGTTGNVIVSRDNLPWNVRLIVTPIDSATANFIVFSGKLTDKELLALFDLKLIDTLTGEAYELPAGQTVTVEMGGVLLNGAMNTVIAHEKPDGTIEYISATVEGTKITFKASSFSLYGVATQNTSASTSTSNSSNPGSTTNPDTYDSGTGNSDFPDTRDSSKVTLWVLLCGMALIGLVITGRRRKSGLYKMENND